MYANKTPQSPAGPTSGSPATNAVANAMMPNMSRRETRAAQFGMRTGGNIAGGGMTALRAGGRQHPGLNRLQQLLSSKGQTPAPPQGPVQ